MTKFIWRAMTAADVAEVVALAAAAFPDHFERRACFENRLALFPQGCFVLGCQDRVEGYLIAYPWPVGAIPPLNSLLGGLPETIETIYLHDLALGAAVRGRGHARPIIERLVRTGRELGAARIALVSVNGTVPFWHGLGFAPVTHDPTLPGKLLTYGDAAAYMIRDI
jgi:GNAT superfamily N-acetyltransferase